MSNKKLKKTQFYIVHYILLKYCIPLMSTTQLLTQAQVNNRVKSVLILSSVYSPPSTRTIFWNKKYLESTDLHQGTAVPPHNKKKLNPLWFHLELHNLFAQVIIYVCK